jgi:hypothetical protein
MFIANTLPLTDIEYTPPVVTSTPFVNAARYALSLVPTFDSIWDKIKLFTVKFRAPLCNGSVYLPYVCAGKLGIKFVLSAPRIWYPASGPPALGLPVSAYITSHVKLVPPWYTIFVTSYWSISPYNDDSTYRASFVATSVAPYPTGEESSIVPQTLQEGPVPFTPTISNSARNKGCDPFTGILYSRTAKNKSGKIIFFIIDSL